MGADGSAERDTFVDVPGNPRPDGAQVVWFDGANGRRLRAALCPSRTPRKARGTVIVCPGRTEFIEKYFETARDLQDRGFAVLILDWPGQGLSDRLLADTLKGHIDNFETFMNALAGGLKAFDGDLPRPYVCLAHSMGGAIALAALLERKVDVVAAAFSAPMWGLQSPVRGLRYLVWAMRVMGRSKKYAQRRRTKDTFETNLVTHDQARWEMHRKLVEAQPELSLGPVTWGWLGAALDIIDAFVDEDRLTTLDIPLLIASAEKERLVDNAAQARIASLLPNAEHVTIAGAYHELLMEQDPYRDQFWAAFDRLLDRAGI